MNIIGTIISVVLITLILNFVFTKFNILIDQTSISNHKSFINGHKIIPLSGGLVFYLGKRGKLENICLKLWW